MSGLAVLNGLFLRAGATALVHLIGTPLFNAGSGLILGAFAATVPAIWAALHFFWRVTQAFPEDRLRT